MESDIIDEKELMKKFRFCRRTDLLRCLQNNKIMYHLGKGGAIVTTIQAINAPLIDQNTQRKSDIEFE